jgi:hypothetical protein
VYYAYKDMVAGKGPLQIWDLIYWALPVIGKAKTIFRMAKLNRVGKPTVGLKKAMDGVVNNLKHKQSYRGTSSLRKNSFRIEQ